METMTNTTMETQATEVKLTRSEKTRRSLDNVFGSNENYLTLPVTVYGTKKSKEDKNKLETTVKLKTLLVSTNTVVGDLDNDVMYSFDVVLKFAKSTVTALSLSLSFDGKITTKIDDSLLMESKYTVDAMGLGMGTPCHKIAKESLAKLSLTHDPAIMIFCDLLEKLQTLNGVSIDQSTKLPIVTRLDLDPIFTLSVIASHGVKANENDILYLYAMEAQKCLPATLDADIFDNETPEDDSFNLETATKKQLLDKCQKLDIDLLASMPNDTLRELLTVNV